MNINIWISFNAVNYLYHLRVYRFKIIVNEDNARR